MHAIRRNLRKRENKKKARVSALEMDGYDLCCCETSARAMISMAQVLEMVEEKEKVC